MKLPGVFPSIASSFMVHDFPYQWYSGISLFGYSLLSEMLLFKVIPLSGMFVFENIPLSGVPPHEHHSHTPADPSHPRPPAPNISCQDFFVRRIFLVLDRSVSLLRGISLGVFHKLLTFPHLHTRTHTRRRARIEGLTFLDFVI